MEKRGALENLTVIDLTRVVAGPYCSMLLADLGARVIKVEVPGKGDDIREYGPQINGEGVYFANLNRNKFGISLNLKHPSGKALFLELIKKADILIENFRPGVMERLGLGYDTLKEINDQLIYAAVSGFGSYGPYSQRPGYDMIAQAMGGLMSITGPSCSEPSRCGTSIGDVLGGMNLAIGVLAAVNARQLTGQGQKVDVALVDSVVACLENALVRYIASEEIPERHGNASAFIAPSDSYKAKDGYVIISCGNQKLYEIFCSEMLQMPELIFDQRFVTVLDRKRNNEQLKAIIESWMKDYTVDEVTCLALQKGIPAGPIYNLKQVVEDEHIAQAREMILTVEHPVIGSMKVNGNPIKLLNNTPKITKPAPTLGQHNAEIYRGMLGLSQEQMERYAAEGVI